MVWLQVFATTVVCGEIIADVIKSKHQDEQYQTDCDSCVFLKQKTRWSWDEFKYHCKKHYGFDKPPIFCADYQKRNEEK